MVGRFNFLLGWPFLKGTSSTAAPAPMPLASQHQKTETATGSSSGKHRTAVLDRTTDSRQLSNFQEGTEFWPLWGIFSKAICGKQGVFLNSSFAFFLYLSKRAFQLDNFSIETSLLQLPENQTTHTHTEIFSGKTRNSHVQHTRPRYHQHHPPSHPVVMKLKWGRPRGWRDGVVLVLIGRQGIKIQNGDDLEGARSSLCPFKIP